MRVAISPAATGATYTVNGSAVSNIATTGFTLAANATQTLTIGNLTVGTTYMISLTTVGSNGIAHADIVNRSVVLSVPTVFTVAAANRGAVVVSSNLRTMATISWVNPGNATSVALATSPATGVTASTVTTIAGASNSVTVSGLSPSTAYTFTVTATNNSGNTPATATLTPSLPVVLWEASNAQDGDFGFAYCQTELAGGASDTSGVHKTLYDAGYRTAKFYGSTPDYNYIDIATDADALGAVGTRPLVTAAGSSFTVPAQLSGNPMTLGDFTKSGFFFDLVSSSITNPTINAVLLGLNTHSNDQFWSFVGNSGTYDSRNCSNASSNAFGTTGIDGRFNTGSSFIQNSILTCNTTLAVLCIAKWPHAVSAALR